jgi:hypothetical protein
MTHSGTPDLFESCPTLQPFLLLVSLSVAPNMGAYFRDGEARVQAEASAG